MRRKCKQTKQFKTYEIIIIISIIMLHIKLDNVFFDVTLLPVFYANREPFGKMLTLIDFAFEKKKKENYYCYWRSICQIMIMIKNFYQ